ncbi:MAG: hypothetical protein KBT28_10930, partial [Bacteroidales bacterium]|nr:hypothetical protein [Candidatus Colimorpha merdihippi]
NSHNIIPVYDLVTYSLCKCWLWSKFSDSLPQKKEEDSAFAESSSFFGVQPHSDATFVGNSKHGIEGLPDYEF